MSNATIANTRKKKGRFDWCCRREIPVNTFKQIRPILRIIKFIGVFPCKTTSRGVKTSGILEYAWATMWMILRIVPLIVLPPTFAITLWKIFGVVFVIKDYCFYAAMLVDTFNYLCKNRTIVSFFEKLEKFDEEARHMGHPRQQRIAAYWILTGVSVGITTSMTALGLPFCATVNGCAWISSQILLELHHVHLTLKWIILIHAIHQRFRHLNDIIGSDVLVRPPAYTTSRGSATRDVAALRQNLVEIVDIFNTLASITLLLSFTGLFLTILLHAKNLSHTEDPLIIKLLGLTSFAQIAALCYVCDMTATEANVSGRHLTDCATTLKYSSAIEERMSLSLHLMHNKIAFTGGDFFTIDLAAFFEILLAFFSFTVILWGFE